MKDHLQHDEYYIPIDVVKFYSSINPRKVIYLKILKNNKILNIK